MAIVHGITATESSDALRALHLIAGGARLRRYRPAADGTLLPLDTPVVVSDPDAAIDAAGTNNTLRTLPQTIADQGPPLLLLWWWWWWWWCASPPTRTSPTPTAQ